MTNTNAHQEDSLRKLLVDFTSDIPVIGVGEARDILEEELEKYVSKEKRAAQERLLDELMGMQVIVYKKDHLDNDVPLSAVTALAIHNKRQALGEEQ